MTSPPFSQADQMDCSWQDLSINFKKMQFEMKSLFLQSELHWVAFVNSWKNWDQDLFTFRIQPQAPLPFAFHPSSHEKLMMKMNFANLYFEEDEFWNPAHFPFCLFLIFPVAIHFLQHLSIRLVNAFLPAQTNLWQKKVKDKKTTICFTLKLAWSGQYVHQNSQI